MQTTIELVAGLPRDDLLQKLYFHNRQGEISQRALGYYLLDMHRRGEFRPGFRSAAHWAEEKLLLKRADRLVFIAKQLEELPAIDGAFSRGEVPWTKVREMAGPGRETSPEADSAPRGRSLGSGSPSPPRIGCSGIRGSGSSWRN